LKSIEIFLNSAAILGCLYIILINTFRKSEFGLNRAFIIIPFLALLFFANNILYILNIPILGPIDYEKIHGSILILLSGIFFFLSLLYPKTRLSTSSLLLSLISLVPGIATGIVIVITDFIYKIGSSGGLSKGMLYSLFPIIITIYLLGALVILFVKSRRYINRVFSYEAKWFIFGLSLCILPVVFLSYIFPDFFGLINFRFIIQPIMGMYAIIIINYSIYDLRIINFPSFYLKLIFWSITSILLFLPLSFLIYYSEVYIKQNILFIIPVSAIMLLYLMLFFKYIISKVDFLFQRKYKNLSTKFNEMIQLTPLITDSDSSQNFWEELYHKTVEPFKSNFNILNASLYMFSQAHNQFIHVYGFGEEEVIQNIDSNSSLVQCLKTGKGVLEKSALYIDGKLKPYRDETLEFLKEIKGTVFMPFFNDNGIITSLFILGDLDDGKVYSRNFLELLELYRIQFQRLINNGIVLEEVRNDEIKKHDQLVVNNIKNKIIPVQLHQHQGIRISSFHINNSKNGGDFYDSIITNNDKCCFFIADCKYSGITSGLTSLQLYSSLNSQSTHFDSASNILNTMNHVVTSSNYEHQYTPALCLLYDKDSLTYSSAAFNPMITYNPSKDEFVTELSKGVPLGTDEKFIFQTTEIKASKGMIGLVFSEGLTASINNEGDKYPFENIKKIIKDNWSETPTVLVRKIFNDYSAFINEKDQYNDISLIIFQY